MKILIITGGSLDKEFTLDFLKKHKFDEVIAVDGGLERVQSLQKDGANLSLTHIVGDFDTVDHAVLDAFRKDTAVKIHAYKPEKDYTDTDIALKLAISLIQETGKRHGDVIFMLGATGTRLDHVLANMQMLKMAMNEGIDCVIADRHNRIRMIREHFEVNEKVSRYISLIPVTQFLEGVTLRGFKYPLSDHRVTLGESLCVSNEIIELPAVIEIKKGEALLIESDD